MTRTMLAVSLATACCLAAGCASRSKTRLTQVWRDDAYDRRPAGKILVIGVGQRAANQRMYEEAMAARLRTRGVEAVEGATIIPPGTKVDRPTVAKAIADKGIDLVLLTRLISLEGSSEVVPGGASLKATALGQDFWGFYVYALQETQTPDTLKVHVVADLETRVYETSGETWSGAPYRRALIRSPSATWSTRSAAPSSASSLARA